MSTNLNDQSSASTTDPAAIASGQSPDSAAANAADLSADHAEDSIAASGPDAKQAELDRQYDERNLLSPTEDQEAAPETKPEPKKEPEPEKEPEPDAEEVVIDDPLAEPQNKARSADDINRQYSRAPIAVREDLARVESEKWRLKEEIEKAGGPIGLEVAQSFMPVLLNHNPGPAEAEAFLGSVADVNPNLLVAGSRKLLDQSLTDTRPDPETGTPINIATGNYLVKQYLSDKLDLETVEKLVQYEEAGLIDHDEMAEKLETYSGKTEREIANEKRITELEGRLNKESQAAELKATQQVEQRISRSDSFISKQVMGSLIPVAEQYGWTATKEELSSDKPEVKETAEFKVALGDFITPWLEYYRQKLPESDALQSLAKDGLAFNQDGNPTAIYKKNLAALDAKVLATFKAKVRVMNRTLGKAFGNTRAAQLKAKTTRSGAVETQIPSVKKTNGQPESPEDRQVRLDRDLDSAYREDRASL